MTEAILAAALRRRTLVSWAASIHLFHVAAGDPEGQERMLRVLRALDGAGDMEVTAETPRLAGLLRQETALLRVEGTA